MKLFLNISSLLKLLTVSLLLFACGAEEKNETLAYVFTLVSAEEVPASDIINGTHRYAPGMKVAVIEAGRDAGAIDVITEEFYSARSPEVSFDGKQIIFSGRKNEGDVWQIWLYDMKKGSFSQVTASEANCTDPTWLPDGRIAYSKQVTERDGLKHHALFYIQPDGCCEQRITFQPHEDLNPTVMHDGRILFSSIQITPEKGVLKYLAMRPDGTKAELFCQPDENAGAVGKAGEGNDGKVYYPEDGRLISVTFNRPLHTRERIHEKPGIFQSVSTLQDGLLVTVSHEKKGIFGLEVIKEGGVAYTLSQPGHHIVEAVVITARPVPKKLPTRVDPKKHSGFMICLDTDASDIAPAAKGAGTAVVEIIGPEGLVGSVDVAEDGSFNLELPADTPLKFKTYDAEGNLLRGPSAWVWVRPAEHRGCVGCHEDRELSPENRVPKSLASGPVSLVAKDISIEKSHE